MSDEQLERLLQNPVVQVGAFVALIVVAFAVAIPLANRSSRQAGAEN